MNQADVDEVIRELARLSQTRYVFEDVGAQIGRVLAQRSAAGRYAGVADAAALAALATEDLQAVNGDKHLRLLYSADELPASGDDQGEVAALARWAALSACGMARVERLDGNIGYLDLRPVLFPPSMAGDAAAAAMSLVAPADALIIDLRQCLGGDPGAVALLCSYLFDDEPVHLIDLYEREGNRTRQSWTLPYAPGRRLGSAKPVDLLTSGTTFSGGEELCYDLQQLGRAAVIGERTGGGAHPREAFTVHPHLQATIPVARGISPVTGTNWEGTGVIPDIEVPAGDAFGIAYQRALRHVLSLGDDGDRARTAGEAQAALSALPD
jgi:C-terminal processing protease CtpA/Prc